MAAATADPPDLAQLQHDLTLDSDKLLAQAQQDRGDLYLLTWLTTAEQSLAKAPDVSALLYWDSDAEEAARQGAFHLSASRGRAARARRVQTAASYSTEICLTRDLLQGILCPPTPSFADDSQR